MTLHIMQYDLVSCNISHYKNVCNWSCVWMWDLLNHLWTICLYYYIMSFDVIWQANWHDIICHMKWLAIIWHDMIQKYDMTSNSYIWCQAILYYKTWCYMSDMACHEKYDMTWKYITSNDLTSNDMKWYDEKQCCVIKHFKPTKTLHTKLVKIDAGHEKKNWMFLRMHN